VVEIMRNVAKHTQAKEAVDKGNAAAIKSACADKNESIMVVLA